MTSAWSQLEQMLTCAICLDKFKNPRLLPCQHSFCGDACMEGLVDYARRQIKCPECRAEHRIPYQGISSLPSNVTLIRFLELHSRITGEEPEPVPTFLEKCSVCGEKVEGVARCAHCEKKVCPECKDAHLDLLRREIARVNGQTRRCLGRLQEFRDSLGKAAERVEGNRCSVKAEIEGSTRRLLEDMQGKQRKLCEEVDGFAEQELRTIERLKVASAEELETMEGNLRLADEKLSNKQLTWTDQELSELREIYTKAMEFMRLFEPDLGDFSRKIRFSLLPEFETLRRRMCELGELKFSESIVSQMASSLSYCNATGSLALELCQQVASWNANGNGNTPNALSQSGSSSNLSGQVTLELPGGSNSLQNSLMRSQSDHRLASQFQQRLKREQQQQQLVGVVGGQLNSDKNPSSRYTGARDYETESLRSRYAPPRSAAQDSLLTRDWPRPSDATSSSGAPDFGSSIHFKSAFMRRKEKERQQAYGLNGNNDDDDDDLASEASSSYLGARNVRFHEPLGTLNGQGASLAGGAAGVGGQQVGLAKLFDVSAAERAPLSGIPHLEQLPYLLARLHEMGARAVVDKKNTEEEGKKDKDLVESARQSVSRASERRAQARQASEDEIEKQKHANQQAAASATSLSASPANNLSQVPDEQVTTVPALGVPESTQNSPVAAQRPLNSLATDEQPSPEQATSSSPGVSSARRNLYGTAVTERSRRQLSSATQEAASYSRRRAAAVSTSQESPAAESAPVTDTSVTESSEQVDSSQPLAASSTIRPRRALRSSTRSISRQSSADQQPASPPVDPSSPAARRARRLITRAETARLTGSQESSSSTADTPIKQTKNFSGSGDNRGNLQTSSSQHPETSGRSTGSGWKQPEVGRREQSSAATTDEDDDKDDYARISENTSNQKEESNQKVSAAIDGEQQEANSLRAGGSPKSAHCYHPRGLPSSDSNSENNSNSSSDDEAEDEPPAAGVDIGSRAELTDNEQLPFGSRNHGNRRSRELLPNAVNKLLDRSAQIRRDSQEQRTRGASPQRQSGSSTPTSSRQSTRDYADSAKGQPVSSASQSSFYSSTRIAGSGTRRPGTSGLYQRYQQASEEAEPTTGNSNNNNETTNSNNSIYTTASSSATRRSSPDSESNAASRTGSSRRLSGNSSDRTLTSAQASADSYPRSAYLRRDSSTDTPSLSQPDRQPYQSRFLARSRTSAALSSAGSARGSSGQDDESSAPDYLSSGRSYLSSRDRFMQSAALMSSSSSSATAAASSASPAATHHGYSRGGSSSSSSAGVKTHSEYLRNKFSRRNSSSSSALSRSRSFHAPVANGSNEDELDDDLDDAEKLAASRANLSSFEGSAGTAGYLAQQQRVSSSRRSSLASQTVNSFDSQSSSTQPKSVYSGKRRMLYKLGSRGPDPGSFTWPRGVAVGLGGRGQPEIVVADSSNHRVQIFDLDGKFLNEFGSYGSAPAQFDCLAGVAINRPHKVYVVSDRYNHRIQIFDMAGKFVRAFGELGREPGKFNLPWGVACDSSGLIYVCDKENHRVQVFDVDGTELSRFGVCGSEPGQLQHPHYIAVSSSKLVVTDTNNHRVQVFDLNGRMINTFGREGSAPGQFKFPRGIAMDDLGNVIVGDSGNNRLQIFSPDGCFIKSIGTWGSADGEFKGIEGVAVDSRYNILVCDRENHRIQVF